MGHGEKKPHGSAFAHLDDDEYLCAVGPRVTAARTGQDVGDGRGSHVTADCSGGYRQYRYSAAVAEGELASWELFWSQLEPNPGGETS